jgi:putative ABC transport system substrate-binding protein
MKRRDLLSFLGGAAATWPLATRAQQGERMRRIGAHLNLSEADTESKLYVAAFEKRLAELGWVVGRNVQIDYRWTMGEAERIRRTAAELIALNPDVILTAGGNQIGLLQQLTSTIPIVFVLAADPVGAGYVASLARPGGNTTGFTVFEFGIGGKWLELLKQIAPGVVRVAVLRDATNLAGVGLFGAVQTAGPSLGAEVSPIGLRDAGEIERGIAAFARGGGNGGLIVQPSSLAIVHRELIVAQAARHRLPAVYPFRYFVTGGGLIYYGPDPVDQHRQAAGYVDRILRGEKPADLPVQAPVKYQLTINLKTAKALGLTVPPSALARADEVIE